MLGKVRDDYWLFNGNARSLKSKNFLLNLKNKSIKLGEILEFIKLLKLSNGLKANGKITLYICIDTLKIRTGN